MNTAWAHLPNAAHIDTVLEFVKTHAEHPAWDVAWDDAWDDARDAALDAAWDAARNAAWDATWDAAWDAAWNTTRNAAWDATRHAARNAARNAAWNAVIALVAWDSAGELLDRPLADVQALAALDEPAAVMLLAYTTSRENITT